MLASGSCFDFWLNRYQTLLTGVAAIIATGFAIRLARNQVSIGERQVKIMADQQKQTKAIATIKVDEALRVLEIEKHWVLAKMLGSGDNWGVNGVEPFRLPSPIDDLTSSAALAFPDRAIELSDVFHAAADLSAAYEDFNSDPWQIDVVLNAMDLTDKQRSEYRDRRQAGGEAVAKFANAWGKIVDLAPGNRVA